jgi:Ca2+-binding RTX toxin-like protein
MKPQSEKISSKPINSTKKTKRKTSPLNSSFEGFESPFQPLILEHGKKQAAEPLGSTLPMAKAMRLQDASTPLARITEEIKPWMVLVNGEPKTGYAGDYGLLKLWDEGIRGQGVKVGINDTEVVLGHTEFDYAKIEGNGSLVAKNALKYSHGTAVAGVIGAQANGVGVVGVANESRLWLCNSQRFLTDGFVQDTIDAGCDVINNSWGPLLVDFNFESQVVLRKGFDRAAEGRKGLGLSIVFAAGNKRQRGWDTAANATTIHENVIAVAAVDIKTKVTWFSTSGDTVHVAALGEDVSSVNVDDLTGKTNGTGSGTSYAAPFVSGVVALMYQANPGLGLRDVQEILAYSARLPLTGRKGFQANGGTHANGGGLPFSRDYGFGLVNALAAVRLAQSWFYGGFEAETALNRQQEAIRINMNEINTNSVKLKIPAKMHEVEHVNLFLDLDIRDTRDLRVVLTSPLGTESVLMDKFGDSGASLNQMIDLGSRRFWGENGAGEWSLKISSNGSLKALRSASLLLSGGAETQDDRYVYTDEFNTLVDAEPSRLLLEDTDGGHNTFNAACVTGSMVIDLRAGTFRLNKGREGRIEAGTVIETVIGGDGHDFIAGDDHVGNSLYGGNGDDTLDGGNGTDTLVGGRGNDWYYEDSRGDVVIEQADEGIDTLLTRVVHSKLLEHVEKLVMLGEEGLSARGNALNNELTGNNNDNVLSGEAGNDTLSGGGGIDELDGGSGADVMEGGRGDDFYRVDDAGDVVRERAGEGNDLVESSLTYTLGEHVEGLRLGGSDDLNGSGNALNNLIVGNAGDNVLDGGLGKDTLGGGLGNDTYFVDNEGDVVIENTGEGTDLINSRIDMDLPENVEALALTSSTADYGEGNALDNLIRGSVGKNVLFGKGGNDVLEGGAGNDYLVDPAGTAVFNGGTGNDTLLGGDSAELNLGGLGNDSLIVGGGNDVILFNKGDGKDRVLSQGEGVKTLSLGGGFSYKDLRLSKSGQDLVVGIGAADQISFLNWYAAKPSRPVVNLQVIGEALRGYKADGSDPMHDQKVEHFDFAGLVGAFDAELKKRPSLKDWSVMEKIRDFQQEGTNSAALGGDLAYHYGRYGTLAGIGLQAAQAVIGDSVFGAQVQTLHSRDSLRSGPLRLS